MKMKIKLLFISIVLSSGMLIVSKNYEYENYNQKTFNDLAVKNLQGSITNIPINTEISKAILNKSYKELNSKLVSHIVTSNFPSNYSQIVPKTTFVSFWSSLNELGKALFIGFLSTAAVSVVSTIGYGIYKGINNNKKEPEAKIENKENAEANNKEEAQSGPGDYKLTLTITNNSEKSKEWYVYSAGGAGFQDSNRKIGSLGNEQNSEDGKMSNDGKMTKNSDGTFSFTFDKVQDPCNVTIILKTGNNGNKTQSMPFKLGNFIKYDSNKNNIYFVDDSEANSEKSDLQAKSGAIPIGNILVTKINSENKNKNINEASMHN